MMLIQGRDIGLTSKGNAALKYADAMDQAVLDAYFRASRPGDTGNAQIIWRRRGQPVSRTELESCLEGLVAEGYLRPAGSGYVLTKAGERRVLAYDQAHPTWTARFRVIGPSARMDRRTRDEARELARYRHQALLAQDL